MDPVITVTLTKAVAATNLVGFGLTGADFVLDLGTAAELTISGGATNCTVLGKQIYIATGVGAQMSGMLTIAIVPDSAKTPPTFVVNNITFATGSITWPTDDGPVTQALTTGTPMPLAGISASED
uniref:Uncharacterized protein n=1 Tax=Caulobacter sp. (strain K31) TaxID=366602 RepID=B0T4K4_CAUSK